MIRNPTTGRPIKVGGPTYKKLLRQQRGGDATIADSVQSAPPQSDSGLFGGLLKKAENMGIKQNAVADMAEINFTGEGSSRKKNPIVPDSKYHLLNSKLPPNPPEQSWYHYHAPLSQNFGDYVCLKRSTLKELGTFLKDSLFADINAGSVK